MDLLPKQESFNLLRTCSDVDFASFLVGNVLQCKTLNPESFEMVQGSPALVGLPNVTNDLQAYADFTLYNLKSPPVDNDWVLINDSEDNYKIKKVKVISLETAYLPDIDIAIDLSSADFIDLYANPKLIINAPGTGKFIEIIWAAVHMHYGTVPYTCDSTAQQRLGTLATGLNDGIYNPQDVFNAVNKDASGLFLYYGYQFAPNLPIYLASSHLYSLGDSTFTLHVKYRVRTM